MTPPEPTRTHAPRHAEPPTGTFDPTVGAAGAALDPDRTADGWTPPPILRDEPSEHLLPVRPLPELPLGADARYELLGEVARGGMGVIIKGRDPNLGRDLAVKVLRAELVGRPGAEQRFVEEAQVGGQLQHPGVVPVYDLGRLGDGRPFFAMKLVKGRTLAELLAERVDPSADRGRFLQVFLQVCQTVGYAHSRGVIHRDLKPANVMVGSFGEVLVMDWGLAKVLPRGAGDGRATPAGTEAPRSEASEEPAEIHTAREATGTETATGSVMGTLAYMAPEQAAGETDKLDERADVFGLGAVLCVVLTGKPPYAGANAGAVQVKAIRGEQADAFARLDACGTDAELVALCKRCLAPAREARPRHAGEVAAAVAAYLAEVEQRAQRAEFARAAAELQAREQRKRREVQAALGLAFTALVVAGGAFAWYWDHQAAAERGRLARNADALTALLDQAESALRGGEAAKAGPLLDAADARAAEGGAVGADGRRQALREDLAALRGTDAAAQAALTWNERFPTAAENADRYRAVLAAIGADPDVAGPQTAADRVRQSAVRDPLVAALDRVLWPGRSPAVRAVLRAADPDPFRDAVRDAVAANDARRVLDLTGRPEAADQPPVFLALLGTDHNIPADRRLALMEAGARLRPGNLWLYLMLGCVNEFDAGRPKDAIRWYEAAVAASPRSFTAHNFLGSCLRRQGDLDGALACQSAAVRINPNYHWAHCEIIDILKAKAGTDAAVTHYRQAVRANPEAVGTRTAFGLALRDSGDLDGAVAAFREAVRLDPKYVWADRNLGWVLRDKGDWAGAVAAFREWARLEPDSGAAHNELAQALYQKGDLAGALAEYQEVVRIDPKHRAARKALGDIRWRQGDWDGAVATFREWVRAEPNDAEARDALGWALYRKGDPDGALAEYREAVRLQPNNALWHTWVASLLLEKGDPKGALTEAAEGVRLSQTNANAHEKLGWAREGTGDLDGAVAAFREWAWREPGSGRARNALGIALREKGDWDVAVAAFREAVRVDPGYVWAHGNLGLALLTTGDVDGAVVALREAIRLNPDPDLDPGPAHAALAYALCRKGDLAGALAEFREAIRLAPQPGPDGNAVGLALLKNGSLEAAAGAFREAIRLEPKHVGARRGLGLALLERNHLDGAVAACREWARLEPDSGPAHSALAYALYRKGDLDGALAECREAIRFDSGSGRVRNILGIALRKKGDPGGAVAAFRDAVRLEPNDVGARNALAWLLAAGPDGVRDGKKAIEHATRACELTGWKDPWTINTLAAAYAAAGDFGKAVEYLKQALSFPEMEQRSGAKLRERLDQFTRKEPYYDPELAPREGVPPMGAKR